MAEMEGLSTLLPVEAILLRQVAVDWRAAVRLAGRPLAASGATDAAYADEMIATVEELGPYIVIAPGVAWCRISSPAGPRASSAMRPADAEVRSSAAS